MDGSTLPAGRAPDPAMDRIVKLAVMAVGGQGGGVLTGWIEKLARAQGYACQATSVAGVSQRTGATIYYVELAPEADRRPVFSLAPAGGDVDILIAAEMMEAGRAILRGFVTPDRTTLIASTHRALAVSEKMVPGDGIANAAEVMAACEVAAQRFVSADFEAAAVGQGSVISASLFGALAGSQALPFSRDAFEAAIRSGGRGVDASLAAFAAGYELAQSGIAVETARPAPAATKPSGPAKLLRKWEALTARVAAFPPEVAVMAEPGLRKVVDFMDVAYGAEYLDRIDTILARDDALSAFELTAAAAKHVANAMAYDDTIRVADEKTRAARFARIRDEMNAGDATLMHVTEYMHPRAAEIAGMLPARLGRRVARSPKWMARLTWAFDKGRHYRSDSLRSFMLLHILAGMRSYRRRTLRHAEEGAHLDEWLTTAMGYRNRNYALAVEALRARRLIKGYSDTHARGLSKFDRVMDGIALVADRDDAADWARRLREAALKDEKGVALDGALATIASFA